jgi:hypothetical protein
MAEFGEHFIDGVQVMGDFPIESDLPISPRFRDGDGNGIGVDIESYVVYGCVHDFNRVR